MEEGTGDVLEWREQAEMDHMLEMPHTHTHNFSCYLIMACSYWKLGLGYGHQNTAVLSQCRT